VRLTFRPVRSWERLVASAQVSNVEARFIDMTLCIAQDAEADALLDRDPLALVIGMLLDQQFPMERAFAGPALLAERVGTPERLDARMLADYDVDELTTVFRGPPAVHRYPGSMAGRVQAVCAVIADTYDGDASGLWADATTGKSLYERLVALPGFGDQKARIFVALLGKQRGVRPRGWRAAAGDYGDDGSRRSVADVRDGGTLAEVRAFKQAAKAAAKSTGGTPRTAKGSSVPSRSK
jgi:uncharacterized HhH-GPD family protein